MKKLILLFCLITLKGLAQYTDSLQFGYVDNEGAKQGIWKSVDSVKMLTREMTYKNDKLHGIYQSYDKYMKTELYYTYGKKNGWAKKYVKARLIEANLYENDSLVYVIKYNLKGGIREEYGVKNLKENGFYITYDNKQRLIFKEEMKEGVNHGIRMSYYKNGNVKSINYYNNGENSGVSTSYDKKGIIINQCKYDKNGNLMN